MANYNRRFNVTCYTVPALVDTCRMTTTSLTMCGRNSRCALWHYDQNYIFKIYLQQQVSTTDVARRQRFQTQNH
eukprot:6612038-Ditylum_brightwellii.AAC.1